MAEGSSVSASGICTPEPADWTAMAFSTFSSICPAIRGVTTFVTGVVNVAAIMPAPTRATTTASKPDSARNNPRFPP